MEITSETFNLLKNNGKPLVVEFCTSWCKSCMRLRPVIEELAKEYNGKITIDVCNIEDEGELGRKFAVRTVPTVLFFKNGVVIDKMVGAIDAETLRSKIENL